VPALHPAQTTQPNITNRSSPHYAGALALTVRIDLLRKELIEAYWNDEDDE
jgi:hypothetical protein